MPDRAVVWLPELPFEGDLTVNAGFTRRSALPEGIGLRLVTGDNPISSNDFEEQGLIRVDDAWETPDFATAQIRRSSSTSRQTPGSLSLNPRQTCDRLIATDPIVWSRSSSRSPAGGDRRRPRAPRPGHGRLPRRRPDQRHVAFPDRVDRGRRGARERRRRASGADARLAAPERAPASSTDRGLSSPATTTDPTAFRRRGAASDSGSATTAASCASSREARRFDVPARFDERDGRVGRRAGRPPPQDRLGRSDQARTAKPRSRRS